MTQCCRRRCLPYRCYFRFISGVRGRRGEGERGGERGLRDGREREIKRRISAQLLRLTRIFFYGEDVWCISLDSNAVRRGLGDLQWHHTKLQCIILFFTLTCCSAVFCNSLVYPETALATVGTESVHPLSFQYQFFFRELNLFVTSWLSLSSSDVANSKRQRFSDITTTTC